MAKDLKGLMSSFVFLYIKKKKKKKKKKERAFYA